MNIPHVLNKKNRILLRELTKTEFKLRYQGSVLGYLWALLRPLLMFAILYFVFAVVMNFNNTIPHYPVYLLTGTVLWSFFAECTNQGIQAIVSRGDLLRRVSFPKYIVVVSATFTALINLAINMIVVVFFALLNGVSPSWSWLMVLVWIFELYLFSLSLSFLLGAINVKYRDVTSIWDVIMQALFYAVPIIYPVSMVVGNGESAARMLVAKIMLANPIAQTIQDIRYSLITVETTTVWNFPSGWYWKILPLAIVVVLFVFSSLFFRRKSKFFAEEV